MDKLTPAEVGVLDKLYRDKSKAINSVDKLFKVAKQERVEQGESIINRNKIKAFYYNRGVNQNKWFRKNQNNSFVADMPREQYQLDIAYMSFLPEEYYKQFPFALVCVDVFSKLAAVIALKNLKSDGPVKKAMEVIFSRMGGSPSYIYVDKGQEFTSKLFKDYVASQGTDIEYTHRHALFAERFIKTLKEYMMKKCIEVGEPWYQLLDGFLDEYNKSDRVNSTNTTPEEASKDENSAEVRANLLVRAKNNRTYPPLKVGDRVKVYEKPNSYMAKKTTVKKWSEQRYKITDIEYSLGFKHYKLDGLSDTYQRHELLKV